VDLHHLRRQLIMARGAVLVRTVVRITVSVAVAAAMSTTTTAAVSRALVRAIASLITQVAPHRCESRKDLRSGLRTEPTFCASTVPFLKRMSVGMFRMPNLGGVCGFDSMSILATRS